MATNDILTFSGTNTGSNLLTQAEYISDTDRPIGNQTGVARSKLVNKVLRQASYISASLAQFLVNQTGDDVLDDNTMSEVLTTLTKAFVTPLNPYVGGYAIATSGASTGSVPINFASNIITDSHSLVTTGASWKLTAPFNCYIGINGALLNSNSTDILIYTNNVAGLIIASGPSAQTFTFNATVKLNAGDFIDLRLDGGGTYSFGNFYFQMLGRF